jgi:hypothetical protein
MQHGLSAPLTQDLQSLLNRLQDEEYQYIVSLCDRARADILKLKDTDLPDTILTYTDRCENLIGQVSEYMRVRRLVLLPYMLELAEKEEDGHDCRNCSGTCKVGHADHVQRIRNAHDSLRVQLRLLQSSGLPLYSTGLFPEAYRSLRSAMLLLDIALMEVIFIEESTLIPMLIDLQQKIGAHA